MSTPAQVIEQHLQNGLQQAQQRKQELEDEKRKVTLKTLQDDAETPQDKVAAIDAVYHKDPGVLKQHVENLTRRLTGQSTQPVVPPAQAQQSRLAPIAARGVTPDQQALKQRGAEGQQDLGLQQQAATAEQKRTFDLIDQYVKDPEKNQALKRDYIAKQAGVPLQRTLKEFTSPDGQQRNWFTPGEEPPGWNATQGAVKPKPNVRAWSRDKSGKIFSLEIDPATNKAVPGTENYDILPPSYLVPKISTGVFHWTDENNQLHETPEVRTSSPAFGGGGGALGPRAASGSGQSSGTGAKGPGRPDKILGSNHSPAMNKAQGEYAEAVKLNSLAQQVARNPRDAVNQKRLAVALERTSAGRFTTQALDYIIKAGWGNTIEQWANAPDTGALPADVMRQLVDGAKQNLQGSIEAIDALKGLGSNSGLAPKTATGGHEVGEKKKFPNGKTGVWDGTGWVAQ
jgi:hypothetical protein